MTNNIADDNTPYKRLVTTAAASIPSAVTGGENLFIDSADNLVKKKNSAGTVAAVGGAASVNSFETIVVSGQSDVVADSSADTLTLVAGSGMTITTNAGTDTITLAASGSGAEYPKSAVMDHRDSLVTVGNALTTSIDGGQIDGYYTYQNASANGDTTTNGFVIEAGTYSLNMYSYINTNLGKVDFYIDNVQVGTTQDFYNASLVYNTTKTITGIVMTAGYHTLKTVVNGKNASASTYNFPVTRFTVIPAAY